MPEGIGPTRASVSDFTDVLSRPQADSRPTRSARRPATSSSSSAAQGEALLRRLHLPAAPQRPTRGQLLKQLSYGYAKGTAKEILKQSEYGLVAQPFISIYTLIDGMAKIGNATLEGRSVAEKRAYVAGLVETLYPALENPSLTPEQARKQALAQPEHQQTLEEIYAYRPGSHSTKFAHLQRRLELFERATGDAVKLLRALPSEQRQELSRLLEGELSRTDPRYLNWPDRKAALKELFLLRTRANS